MDSTAFRLRKPEAAHAFSPHEILVHLMDMGQTARLEVAATPASEIAARFEAKGGRLVGAQRLDKDGAEWEMHPAGDELLVALSGAFELVLQDGRSDHVVELAGGQAYLVPFGAWHRVRVKTPGEILFVTPVKGTQRRAL